MRPLIPRPLGAPDPARLARVRTLFDDDATADGVLRWLVRFQRRPAAQVVTLVDDDLQWQFLARLWRMEPALMWLAWAAIDTVVEEGALRRPVRALRAFLTQYHVGHRAWKRMVDGRLGAFEALNRREGYLGVIRHLRFEQLLDRTLPLGGQTHDWLRRITPLLPGRDLYRLGSETRAIRAVAARTIVEAGLTAIRAGRYDAFLSDAFAPVVHHYEATGALSERASWPAMVARAQRWLDETQAQADAERWECGVTSAEFEGWTLEALPSRWALWREGARMGHCIADYTDDCRQDRMRAFHATPPEGGAGWTIALEPDHAGWSVYEVRGRFNTLPDAATQGFAERWAGAYAAVLPLDRLPNGGRPALRGDAICPWCRDAECSAHVVALFEDGEGLNSGQADAAFSGLRDEVRREIAESHVADRPPPPHWPDELKALHDAMLQRLRPRAPRDEVADDGEDAWDEDAYDPDTDDDFHDTWLDVRGDAVLEHWVREWLDDQPGVLSDDYQIDHSPDLTWSGMAYFSREAAQVARALGALLDAPKLTKEPHP